MSNLIEELKERSLPVPNDNKPLGEVEPGRIEAIRTELLSGVGQAEVAQGVGFKSPETVKNWSDDPSSLNRDKAEKLVAYLATLIARRYGIPEETARKVVLDELTKDTAEEAYIKGMDCILSNVCYYLLHDEVESLCDVAALTVLDERRTQAAQTDLVAFLEVAEAWRRTYKARKSRNNARVIEAGNELRDAVTAFNAAVTKRATHVADEGQSV